LADEILVRSNELPTLFELFYSEEGEKTKEDIPEGVEQAS
jgi:hypothetical protein